MSEHRMRFAQAVRAYWWIVAVTAVAGALVAGIVVATAEPQFTGTAAIVVDTATIQREARLPKPDGMVAIAQGEDFGARLSEEAGTSDFELSAYTTGNPQDHVMVEVTHADEAEAGRIARMAGAQLLADYKAKAEPLIQTDLANIEANEMALNALEKSKQGDDLESFFRWNVLKADIAERESLLFVQNAYSFEGEVATGESSRTTELGAAVLGGGLFGLFLGLVIAWLMGRRAVQADAGA